MKLIGFIAVVVIGLGGQTVVAQSASCPSNRTIVDIPGSTNSDVRACERNRLIAALQMSNVTVRLGPDVDFDIDGDKLPIKLGRCVTLTSVAFFEGPLIPSECTGAIAAARPLPRSTRGALNRSEGHPLSLGSRPTLAGPAQPALPSARNPHSIGPVLRYGKTSPGRDPSFFEITCTDAEPNGGDGARISGFRLFGPDFGDHFTGESGIVVNNCLDVEISNMEIAGWAVAGIEINHLSMGRQIPDHDPREILVLIHDNFIHNNQRSTQNGHAFGYGVETDSGAWSKIYNNVFDNNRHSVTADGWTGGYRAERNLILKGGGFHDGVFERDIHVFDVHGNDSCGVFATETSFNCGDAGRSFLFQENVFQYKKTTDIKIRGQPTNLAFIDRNVFARSDKDAAIDLYADCCTVKITGSNQYDVDTFGQYGVCDFDGDGVDDLFLATGVTWWFSSSGKFPWSFLRRDDAVPKNLRFGYFDGDAKCDVLMETLTGDWFISSGGVTDWKPLLPQRVSGFVTNFGHPLAEVQFGRFDASVRDHRRGVTRQTTGAFWRRGDGQWFVTPLSRVDWRPVASSSFPMSELRFGDFTGDGVTDVLAVVGGKWAISESATGQWQTLNPALHDPVQNLFIANMDADDNIDDILRLDIQQDQLRTGRVQVHVTWWRSKNGTGPWTKWKTYTMEYPHDNPDYVPVSFGFVGRFGSAPGATMIIDQNRFGHFFSPAQRVNGASQEWVSSFTY